MNWEHPSQYLATITLKWALLGLGNSPESELALSRESLHLGKSIWLLDPRKYCLCFPLLPRTKPFPF